ncbi:short chain dehydrogenase [Fischerella thermalis CCMEE 5201]|jgi:NAD(P)-dependent dehydrogenase (short-subunit alcohol dehydrogenase family)|nr:short chain dehydrogenase [Fischerella thermalis CCMEE 5201]
MTMFARKVAIITGGSSGIGRATAIAFAKEGAKVVVASRRIQESQETVELIRNAGGEAFFVKTDVSQEADVKTMVEKTIEIYGRLDYGFNNAGIDQIPTPLPEQTEETFDQLININLKGVWLAMKYEIPQMLKTGGGAIVNTASIGGLIGFPGIPIYIASKHAVLGLTKAAAIEYAKLGIRINAISPGTVITDLFERSLGKDPQMKEQIMAMHPIGRAGTPEEIASAVLWLCSEGAGFTIGQSLTVDGGFTVQ